MYVCMPRAAARSRSCESGRKPHDGTVTRAHTQQPRWISLTCGRAWMDGCRSVCGGQRPLALACMIPLTVPTAHTRQPPWISLTCGRRGWMDAVPAAAVNGRLALSCMIPLTAQATARTRRGLTGCTAETHPERTSTVWAHTSHPT